MTGTNAAPAADDDGGIPADLLADEPPAVNANPEDEGFARRMGWRPIDEYRGPKDKWIPADAFIEKVQKEVPVLRERLRSQDAIVQRMENELKETKRLASEQGEALKELLDRSRGAEDRGWEYTRANIKAAMRKAAAEADLNTYAALEQDLEALDNHRPKPKAAAKPADDKPNGKAQTDPAVEAWVGQNRWFVMDSDLHRAALAIEASLVAQYPDTAKRLEKVEEEIKRTFPEKFDNPARRQASTVSQPSGQAARQGNKAKAKTVADLPQDAKIALARIKTRDPKFTDDDYLKHYQWDK